MKPIITAVIWVLFIGLCNSQEKIEVLIEPVEMSQGVQTSFTVLIPEASMELVEKEWKKFLNDRPLCEILKKGGARTFENAYNSIVNIFSKEKKQSDITSLKVIKENDEFVAMNIVHDHVSQIPMDIYGKFNIKENGIEVQNFYRYTDSLFIAKDENNDDLITSLSLYTKMFGIEAYRAVYDNYIRDERKILKKELATLKGLENKNKNIHKNISKLESGIEDYQNEIEFKTENLGKIKKKISETKDKMYKLPKKSLEYESMNGLKKEYESEYKKTRGQIKKDKKKIKNNQNKIVKLNTEILNNEAEQEQQQAVIDAQEAVIDALIAKQDNIK